VANKNERANRIKLVLVDKGIEQQELAKMLGVSPTTVNRWCSNDTQPSVNTIREIGIALKINAQLLIEPTPSE
jgi:transcriptional regulator with XRE-family HTH domain